MPKSTFDPTEVKKFADSAANWWDHNGPLKQLHLMNRVRIPYIKTILQQEKLITGDRFDQLNMLDVGCGGGILSVPLSRLGANVTGLDVCAENIQIAKDYAKHNGHHINYVTSTIEDFAKKRASYDVVCALEIVEHVADINLFLESMAQVAKSGGVIFISTINKTFKSYVQAILIAEYLLKMVPRGGHDWNKFVEPSTIVDILSHNNCSFIGMKGVKFNPLTAEWYLDHNVDVNYIIALRKL
ncbi:MAG: bifunctional 2-polyprenyl-6-hydroxyphenol methylase/3-demethylubiquinol 3-O-methyltransferase UbiG [Candidatus Midichloria sp.]|nr:bifunctional 2-polyprenyl-6-hydroxyphenol methylase/3-demethylubiquinol 3-O-methyltransferase UbiG [Candidatus Midichloria sp.]